MKVVHSLSKYELLYIDRPARLESAQFPCPSTALYMLCVGGMRRDYYRGSQDSLAERAGLHRGNLLHLFCIYYAEIV